MVPFWSPFDSSALPQGCGVGKPCVATSMAVSEMMWRPFTLSKHILDLKRDEHQAKSA